MALDVHVDHSACRGSRSCVRQAPRTFSPGEDGRAVVATEPGDPDDTIREAAAACPFFAIEVREGPG